MKVDWGVHDGMLLLASDRRKGIWATQLLLRGSKTVRSAGTIPTTASAHSLQVLALTTALRLISKGQAAKLLQAAPTGITRPRLLVVSSDATFAQALQAKMRGDKETMTTKPLRAGRNLISIAPAQLARFALTFGELEDGDTSILILKSWASQTIHDPKQELPSALVPSAVSQVC